MTRMMLALAALALSFEAQALNKVVYGTDDRLDVYETTNNLHLELATSTAAMISGNSIDTNGVEATISGSSLQSRGICATAKFAKQATAANCSGFLVGEDLLVTAGHCIRSEYDCKSWKWVFDFAVTDAAQTGAEVKVPSSSVYGCKEIVSRELNSSNSNDFALIRLDRKVTDRAPLRIRTEGKIADRAPLVVIGHPTGLPTKIAAGANVRNNSRDIYFVANLDTFGGNSGSAVFDAETGIVEGILVRGENDYVYDSAQGCRVPQQCTNDSCRGEDVTRVTNIKALMDLI